MSADTAVTPNVATPDVATPLRRNIVVREDGRRINVPRTRGNLFVCSSGCCCGRVVDGFAPIPVELYHNEWERRGLRNRVHLTIGGCLGPCALGNVALLLFDGRAIWLHSMNSPELVIALYDYIEGRLDKDQRLEERLPAGDGDEPLPPALAERRFTASAWQERPDGLPLEDRHLNAPAAIDDPSWTCPTYLPAEVKDALADRAIADMNGAEAMPRRNGELVFEEPWEGRAFGMVVGMYQRGMFEWDEFRDRLIAAIAAAEQRGEPRPYYESWLAALETLMLDKGLLAREALDERTEEFEFGERDEVF